MEPQKDQEDPDTGMQHLWDTQWQQFLQTLQAPHATWGSPQLSQAAPWDDAKAFLASFEQVAAACGWPRGEWMAQLLPALSGEAQQAFSLLPASDKEDYGKVKAAILSGEAQKREMQRQHFRQFCCKELEDPQRMYSQVQELCWQWLRPERHTKEQILELLVLEQFLASMPEDAQRWVWAGGPDSCAQAVALLEAFLLSRKETEAMMWQEPLQEWAVGLLDAKEERFEMMQGEISREHAEIFRDTKEYIGEEVALPGLGIAHPTSLLPPANQDVAEDELNNVLVVHVEQVANQRKTGVPFHVVEETVVQSSQQITFWNVLQEDGENVDSLVKKEETFLPDPVASQRLPGHDLGKELEELRTSFSQKSNLLRHQMIHTGEKPHQCPECGKSFSHKSSLSTHQKIHTGGKPHKCLECGKSFFRRSVLLLHHYVHTGEKPHKCPDCGRCFSNRSSLLKHQTIHTGENPHKCPKCGKNFYDRTALLRHQKIDTEKKPYKCPTCGKSFFRRSNVLAHQIIHTGEKPHKCPKCGKSFSWRSSLSSHQNVHIREELHKCPDWKKLLSKATFISPSENSY